MTRHYLCGVDFQHEMDEGLADFYDSVEELKEKKKCWKQCGIVEIFLDESAEMISYKWIEKQALWP